MFRGLVFATMFRAESVTPSIHGTQGTYQNPPTLSEHFPGSPQVAGLKSACQQKRYQYVAAFKRKRLLRQSVAAHISVPDRALINVRKTRNPDTK
jgi:hypothetical protein